MGGRRGVKGPTPGFSGAESLGGGGGIGAEGSMSCLSATGRGRSRHPYTIQTDIQDPQCVRASTNGTQQGWTNSGWTCVSPWTCLWRGDGTAGSKRERERKPRTKVADKVACKGATHGCRSASHTANGVSDVGLCRWVVCRETSSARSPDPAAPDPRLASRDAWAIPRSEAGGGGGVAARYC